MSLPHSAHMLVGVSGAPIGLGAVMGASTCFVTGPGLEEREWGGNPILGTGDEVPV